jgi:SPP1 gp7 family putative phage head morphogenesis protein
MAWSATAEPQRFQEAVEWFAKRFPLTKELKAQLGEYAGERAWTIAGVAQLDIVLEVYASLLSAIEAGMPFEEWQQGVEPKLTKAWGKRNSPRLETIFRTNVQSAYNAGRWQQMTDPDVKALRPFVEFDGIADSRQSAICRESDGTIVSIDDPWLETHSPPLHHRCRSNLRSLRESEAKRKGITRRPTSEQADKGFGRTPDSDPWRPDQRDYPVQLFAEYEQKRAEIERKARRPKAKAKKKPRAA